MSIQINIKKKFIVNGKEYGSVEEMPEAIRSAHEQALQNRQAAAAAGGVTIAAGKITFNGTEYENEAAMPPEEREQYKSIMGSLEKKEFNISGDIQFNASIKHRDASGAPAVDFKPLSPEPSFSVRKIILGAGIALLFALLYYLSTQGGK